MFLNENEIIIMVAEGSKVEMSKGTLVITNPTGNIMTYDIPEGASISMNDNKIKITKPEITSEEPLNGVRIETNTNNKTFTTTIEDEDIFEEIKKEIKSEQQKKPTDEKLRKSIKLMKSLDLAEFTNLLLEPTMKGMFGDLQPKDIPLIKIFIDTLSEEEIMKLIALSRLKGRQ